MSAEPDLSPISCQGAIAVDNRLQSVSDLACEQRANCQLSELRASPSQDNMGAVAKAGAVICVDSPNVVGQRSSCWIVWSWLALTKNTLLSALRKPLLDSMQAFTDFCLRLDALSKCSYLLTACYRINMLHTNLELFVSSDKCQHEPRTSFVSARNCLTKTPDTKLRLQSGKALWPRQCSRSAHRRCEPARRNGQTGVVTATCSPTKCCLRAPMRGWVRASDHAC